MPDWETYRDELEDLYMTQGRPLGFVMDHMLKTYNFKAS